MAAAGAVAGPHAAAPPADIARRWRRPTRWTCRAVVRDAARPVPHAAPEHHPTPARRPLAGTPRRPPPRRGRRRIAGAECAGVDAAADRSREPRVVRFLR